ncbi:hypothetical protein D1006_39180 [Burkholderia stabilis]|uniref:Uncharacterized protein n=1 Tax=Burkholderia stabilis TaxID=95485 RepID=A0A4Q2A726_9BURK|nr:hypothetical protein [Burkholderia stabilis]RXV64400.1 hypothetical protein D1006_39180 [Burkholderia stabilis]
MNEFTEQRLRDELDASIEKYFGVALDAWRDAGASVQCGLPVLKPANDGRHGASVVFYVAEIGKEVNGREASFVYRPARAGQPSGWVLVSDWTHDLSR